MNPDISVTEAMIVEAGYEPLSADELRQKISNKTVFGDYGFLFKFVNVMEENGAMEGRNNAGAHVFGKWSIDSQAGTISVNWDGGWDNTTTRAYWVDDQIKLFDVDSGQWRTTFTSISDGCQSPVPEIRD